MADTYNYSRFRFSHLANDAKGVWQLQGPQPGDFAPDIELRDTEGQPWRLRAHRGKPVLLHFGSYT
jgi:cytochrome oxidase Cu insertion factor (SCO1/SenC/PrrC family)